MSNLDSPTATPAGCEEIVQPRPGAQRKWRFAQRQRVGVDATESPVGDEGPSLSVGASCGRDARRAGARPKMTPVSDSASVNTSTRASMPKSKRAFAPRAVAGLERVSENQASPNPTAPPPANSMLSVSNWRTNRPRLAPSERTAISGARDVARPAQGHSRRRSGEPFRRRP